MLTACRTNHATVNVIQLITLCQRSPTDGPCEYFDGPRKKSVIIYNELDSCSDEFCTAKKNFEILEWSIL